ncbi:hypothetical protein [Bradyrhizobium sp. CCBAU 45389]|uniref:hypothetical protein n=1 Tax=Bradyrhizobium sp. CCBAU 45389 TaxID=858429 RepID=UPI002304D24F|nr:hypothetical protein [Bradyrhizobium sp. CCBAU 45389]MDA9397708.1 hypothetical protein [Bradyrhizobium sp. CCBAU 45389]
MRPLTGIFCCVALCALIDAAAAQDTRPAAADSSLGELVKIDSFQATRRADNYGIASFVLSNGTDKKIDSIELTCWMDDDRERATKVLVWANQPVPARASYQFKNVNIGVVGPNSRSQCEVTRVD